ncbi:MAG: acyl carrier protein, partial [Bacteroidota bacterium]
QERLRVKLIGKYCRLDSGFRLLKFSLSNNDQAIRFRILNKTKLQKSFFKQLITTSALKDKIIQYIQAEILEEGDDPITSDEDLLTSGLLDSMAAMRLIGFLEEEFEVSVPPEDMVIEHFITVDAIGAYIESKK